MPDSLSPDSIRLRRQDNPKARARDLAYSLGITEADLVAAHVGHGATVIDAQPDRLMPLVRALGDVMALTRNESCVHERRGVYEDYHGGAHAQMVLGPEIDLRIFPSHWVHGFAGEDATPEGTRHSIQIFDAAGDAVHKIHLQPESSLEAFHHLVATLRKPDQTDSLTLAPRVPPQAARADAARADTLRAEWDRMTDTHQFLRLVHRLKMNRQGAYRVAGAPYARRLDPQAVTLALTRAAEGMVPLMIFVGNMGCIQIHGGPVERIVPMGPWSNVMDPRFNLHLRTDRLAEVWLVNKPTQRGAAISVEAFDDRGEIILQIFGYRKDAPPDAWNALTLGLPVLDEVTA